MTNEVTISISLFKHNQIDDAASKGYLSFINWCFDNHLLPHPEICSQCKSNFLLKEDKRNSHLPYIWVCTKKHKRSLTSGTVFKSEPYPLDILLHWVIDFDTFVSGKQSAQNAKSRLLPDYGPATPRAVYLFRKKLSFRIYNHSIIHPVSFADDPSPGVVEFDEAYRRSVETVNSKPDELGKVHSFYEINNQYIFGIVRRNPRLYYFTSVPDTLYDTIAPIVKNVIGLPRDGLLLSVDGNKTYSSFRDKDNYKIESIIHTKSSRKRKTPGNTSTSIIMASVNEDHPISLHNIKSIRGFTRFLSDGTSIHTQTIDAAWITIKKEMFQIYGNIKEEKMNEFLSFVTFKMNTRSIFELIHLDAIQ